MKHPLHLLFLSCLVVSCQLGSPTIPSDGSNTTIQSFMSSGTTTTTSQTDGAYHDVLLETPRMEVPTREQLIEHTAFRISYNASRCLPNWVAYELTKQETYGDVERTDYFDIDPAVSGRQARFSDYSHTGYDRGHMAPAGDMKWDKDAMEECFFLTNICPQNHTLNKGDWNDLEMKCRDWARRYGRAWIVTGPIVSSKTPKTISSRNIVVPDAFFKAVMVPSGNRYKAAGFVMQNTAGSQPYGDCLCTIDELENLTGIDFFYALPDNIEEGMERNLDRNVWR